MNKQQIVLNTRLTAHGWTKHDILVHDGRPGEEAIVYKGHSNSCITYPDGTFDRMEAATPRPREGWYSPLAMSRQFAKTDDMAARMLGTVAAQRKAAMTHKDMQKVTKYARGVCEWVTT